MPPPQRWVDTILQAGRGLLLIDGIDEIPRADRPDIQKALEGLSALPVGNYVVFTTRPDVVGEDWFAGQDLLRAEVSPLSAPDRDQLIDHWHAAARRAAHAAQATGRRHGTRPDPAREAPAAAGDRAARDQPAALRLDLRAALQRARLSAQGPGGPLREALRDAARAPRPRPQGALGRGSRGLSGASNYAQKQVIVQTIAQDMIRAGEASIEAERVDQLIDGKRTGLGIPQDLATPVIRTTLAERSGLLREAYGGALDFMHNTLRDYLAGIAFAQEGQIGELARQRPGPELAQADRVRRRRRQGPVRTEAGRQAARELRQGARRDLPNGALSKTTRMRLLVACPLRAGRHRSRRLPLGTPATSDARSCRRRPSRKPRLWRASGTRSSPLLAYHGERADDRAGLRPGALDDRLRGRPRGASSLPRRSSPGGRRGAGVRLQPARAAILAGEGDEASPSGRPK